MYLLSEAIVFPNPNEADMNGLLAIGGDLSSERLIHAYNNGIFPWFNKDEPILWWSPNPRMVLFPNELHISKSMKTVLKKNTFKITYNTCFDKIIRRCAQIKRQEQSDTWITETMIKAYNKLHEKGIASSVEVWKNNTLVGGLYGIDLKEKKIFCGESMFSEVSNASKTAFIHLVQHLEQQNYVLIDCQMHTTHLESLGAKEISRSKFLSYLQ